jgi:ubiquinone/menaquinone biosynthesis C-methylase UbiE
MSFNVLSFGGQERDLRLDTAPGTNDRVHLAWDAFARKPTIGRAARRASWTSVAHYPLDVYMLDSAYMFLVYYGQVVPTNTRTERWAPASRKRKKKEQNRMPSPREPRKNELESTYFVQDRRNREELTRVTIQDQMLTASMGGTLPEQADYTMFRRVLDVGCGTGGWAIEAARAYPTMSLVGIDISERMIDYACERAKTEQVAERASFRVMDTLHRIAFPSASFDLVNLRLGVSFLRTWDWPELLSEFERVTRQGGIVRLSEADIGESNSPALTQLGYLLRSAFYNAGNFFTLQDNGLTSELVPMLIRCGLGKVQTQVHALTYRAGTPEGQLFAEDMQYLYRTLRPFLQKWTRVPENYDAVYQQALIEMQQADFVATWRFVTAWGSVKVG